MTRLVVHLIGVLLVILPHAHLVAARQNQSTPQTPESSSKKPDAGEAAANSRRSLPVLPALVRGSDGLLNLTGQRATQNQLVTSTNVKDTVTDAFAFTGSLPVEAAEPVRIPTEQFTVQLPKFYATVPRLDPLSRSGWHYSLGVPFVSLRHGGDGVRGFRSATPTVSATGPMAGGKINLFQSFGYRLAKTTVESAEEGHHDTKYQSYDSQTHLDTEAAQRHRVAVRLALFSQDVDSATLTALIEPEATPNYLMRGGQVFFSHSFTSTRGTILDSSISVKQMRLRLLPQSTGPMVFIEQGEVIGNYFDTVRRDASRVEWREALRLPARRAAGVHQVNFGGGLTRSAFDSVRIGGTIILRGHDEDELSSITTFVGSPFEELSSREATVWGEDRWRVSPRVNLSLGLRYDWTTVSRTNQWAPRAGFAVLPFANDRTVIRGGIGVFYDIMPMTVGTFEQSRQRFVEFFHEGEPISAPRALANVIERTPLRTSNVLGFNLEVDHQIGETFLVRLKGEERRGRNLLLVRPDKPFGETTSLILFDTGTSRYRELEATTSYRPGRQAALNFSYVRSYAAGDLNTFGSVLGTFEKLFIGSNRYAKSRSDSPHRFLTWGEIQAPAGLTLLPALDVHTGFPFAFTDADNKIAPEADFGRFPKTVSLDVAVHRDFDMSVLNRAGKLRIGVKVFNVTNHFNPRDVIVTEDHEEEKAVLDRFVNGPGRSYRVGLTWSF